MTVRETCVIGASTTSSSPSRPTSTSLIRIAMARNEASDTAYRVEMPSGANRASTGLCGVQLRRSLSICKRVCPRYYYSPTTQSTVEGSTPKRRDETVSHALEQTLDSSRSDGSYGL
jgi:hypothetical protein